MKPEQERALEMLRYMVKEQQHVYLMPDEAEEPYAFELCFASKYKTTLKKARDEVVRKYAELFPTLCELDEIAQKARLEQEDAPKEFLEVLNNNLDEPLA